MPNQNGGTTEYTNIINGIQGIDSKINEQQVLLENEFSHKINEHEVKTPLNSANTAMAGAVVALGAVTTSRILNVSAQTTGAIVHVATEQAKLGECLINLTKTTVTTATSTAATAAESAMVARGGLAGLSIAGKGLFAVVGRCLGMLANVAIVLYQLWELLSAMCSFQAEVGEKVAFLETELAAEQAKTRRLQQHVTTLEAKVNQLPEKVAQQIERPGGILQGVNTTVNTVNTTANTINTTANAINTTTNTINTTTNTINNTTSEIKQTMGEKFKKLFDWLPITQIFSVLAFVTSVHNAMMLSSNIVQTLASVVDVAFDLIGLKSPEGQSLGVSSILGKKASELIESIIGHQAYTNLSNTIKSTNRLYQASMSIANSIQAAIGNVRSISEVIFGNTGKIGNALLRAGVVFDDAYTPMPESLLSGKMNIVTLINQELQNLDDAANVVQSVVSDTKSIAETVAELKNQKQEFDAAKGSAETAVNNLISAEKQEGASSAIVTPETIIKAKTPRENFDEPS